MWHGGMRADASLQEQAGDEVAQLRSRIACLGGGDCRAAADCEGGEGRHASHQLLLLRWRQQEELSQQIAVEHSIHARGGEGVAGAAALAAVCRRRRCCC